jgi:uncharacterized membrane protein YraQ (UPF0718 family)
VFVSQASLLKYFGAQARKIVLLFGGFVVGNHPGGLLLSGSAPVRGIYTRGAWDRPATAFLYSARPSRPAIVLTARILGWQLGLAAPWGPSFSPSSTAC